MERGLDKRLCGIWKRCRNEDNHLDQIYVEDFGMCLFCFAWGILNKREGDSVPGNQMFQ